MRNLLSSRWRVTVLVAACAALVVTLTVRPRAVSVSSAGFSQNFDGIGTSAAVTLPSDFKVDNPSTVRTVGSYAGAVTATTRAGGANMSTTAGNGVYNFGAGTTTTGGSDRAIGFLSSGTATASGNLYVMLTNASGSAWSGLGVTYNVEKYRNGINPAGFRIQLFYSFDGSHWTDAGTQFATTFGQDTGTNSGFTTAPGATVPVSGTVNVAIAAGANFYLAWNYSVTSGPTTTNGQALAIDDIVITGSTAPVGPTNPTGIGAATPNNLTAGNATLLTVAVTPGANPTSTVLAVTADLSSIGGAAAQPFFDDGTHGDAVAGDLTFSYFATVPADTSAGAKSIAASITDAQNRTVAATIPITVQEPPPAIVAIHEIQGSGDVSPYNGRRVQTTGIVTGVKSNGFFIQTADTDGDPETSEGVFVYTGSALPSAATVNNLVTVIGRVQEYQSMTEISGSPTVTFGSSTNTLPAPVTLTTADTNPDPRFNRLEHYEGMRVTVPALAVVAPTDYGIFYGVIPGVARPFREPGLAPSAAPIPGMPAAVPHFDGNPERLAVNGLAFGSHTIDVTSYATVTGVTGTLDYSGDAYTIDVDVTPTYSGNISAVAVPAASAGQFTIASWNMLNFTNDALRMDKASLTIRNVMLMPDIIGVEEMKDLPTLQALATRVNSDAVTAGQPSPDYTAYLPIVSGTQNVGFLVKSSVANPQVTAVGEEATFIDPRSGLPAKLNDRAPVVLRGTVEGAHGGTFPVTVVVNHLRSLIDVETPGGTGDFARAKRRAGAEYLARLISQYQANGENVISIGDYNAFQFNDGYVDVIGTILGQPTPADQVLLASGDLINPNLADLVDLADPEERYSYTENGSAQTIDHVIVSSAVLPHVAGVAFGRVDADFPYSYTTDGTRPERASDHDPVVAYFNFPTADLSLGATASPANPVSSGASMTFTVEVANGAAGDAAGIEMTTVLPAELAINNVQAPTGWTCTTTPGTTSSAITCTTGVMAAGSHATFTIAGALDCVMPDGELTTRVTVAATGTYDPDGSNNTKEIKTTVSDPPPAITNVSQSVDTLWPVNHKMVPVELAYSVSDNCGAVPVCSLTVSSSEAPDGRGDGQTAADWTVLDDHNLLLRAERSGTGSGRTYTVTISCPDGAGHTGSKKVYVTVPKSQGKQQ